MPRLLAALVLCLVLLAAPAAADHGFPLDLDPASLTQVAEWAGCRGVRVSDVPTGINGGINGLFGLDIMTLRPVILLVGLTDVPPEVRAMIFLHELGHCLQWTEGSLLQMGEVERELDADRRAAELACALHLDGAGLLRALFDWAHAVFDYEGDPSHGTRAQRVGQGAHATACHPRLQAPFRGEA